MTYAVVSVAGDPDDVGEVVDGSGGGSFTINADGSYSFDPGDDFEDLVLAPGEEVTTSVGYHVNANDEGFASGVITVIYFFDEETEQITSRVEVEFAEYGIGGIDGDTSVLPDVQAFVDALLADAGVAGTGDAISILNGGTVTTSGAE